MDHYDYEKWLEEVKNTSELFWPGNVIYVYPRVRLIKTSKNRLCTFCSHIILPGDFYYTYRPLLYNATKKRGFVLHPELISRYLCSHYLPTNIHELEMMQLNLDNSHQYSDSNNLFPNGYKNNLNHVLYHEMLNNISSLKFKELNNNKIKVKTLFRK
jgi:hypothetical protein